MTSTPTKAWVTLLTRTSYLAGCLVLHASLQRHKSAYPLVVFATKELPVEAREVLQSFGIEVHDIEFLEPRENNKVELAEHDHRFADTWTKLRCFELTQYERVVMLDSDMLVLQNMDELMTMDLPPDSIAAAHACTCNPRGLTHYPTEWIPENCAHTEAKLTKPLLPTSFTKKTHHLLNSGLVVLHPSNETFKRLTDTLHEDPIVKTFQFPDQDLLAHVFKGKFMPLSYIYNALKTLKFCHEAMWRDADVKNVHYILDKPWSKRVEAGDPNAETHSWSVVPPPLPLLQRSKTLTSLFVI
ncbi:hypothetical protein RQP46_003031 [Phenoliferia psychrophenolica]